jgi:multimeric flavodoxin WrbA
MSKRVLGVGAGTSGGSAEILLKAALMEAEAAGAQAALLRLDDVQIETAGPLFGKHDDDCRWFFEQVMAADGVIYSAPIYSRLLPGKLRLLADRVFGPHADVGFVRLLMEREAAGEPITVPFTPDERVLRPRVAAFIAVGGALTDQWGTLALPMMHSLAFSMRSGVVDQVRFRGAGTPRSIVLDPSALERARELGRNVAEQLGRAYEEVEYRGEPGLCPLCHLDVIELRGRVVECASCGAAGRLEIGDDGEPRVVFDARGLEKSVNDLVEKRAHSEEILETAARHVAQVDEVSAGAAAFADWGEPLTPPSLNVAVG